MRSILTGALFALLLTGCSSWTPYDYDDPLQRRQQEIKSCRQDPYQDQCEPGAVSPD